MRRILKVVFIGNIILIFFTILALFSPSVNPSENYIYAFFGLMFPWLLMLNFLILVFWIFVDPKRSLLSLFILIVGWGSVRKCFSFDFQKTKQNSEAVVSLVTFNCHNSHYSYINKKIDQKRQEDYFLFFSQFNDADILCVQEMGVRSQQRLEPVIQFPNQFHADEKHNIIYTRYPVKNGGSIEFGTITNSCIWADLETPKGVIRVYSIHLQSNRISQKAEKVVAGELEQSETWDGTKSILKRYKNYAAIRVKQIEKIRDHWKESPYPVVVAGDLNDVPQSYIYSTLADSFNDSFVHRGIGQGATYAGVLPGLRIDYVFTDDTFDILSHRVIKEKYSDHYPVHAFVQLK